MRIKRIVSRNRRDFHAIYECEHCGNESTSSGYDDANFHNNVIPTFECDNCHKTSGSEYEPCQPKYAEGVQV